MTGRTVLDRKAIYREVYLERLSAQLDLWASRIDTLMAKAVEAESGARMAYLDLVDDLDRKRRAFHIKLLQLKVASEEVWDHFKGKLEDAAEELKEGVEQAWHIVHK